MYLRSFVSWFLRFLVLAFIGFSVLPFFGASANAGQLIYSTYLGGNADETGYDITVDSEGNAYITGWTDSSNFPTTTGAWDTSQNNFYDVFVSKLNSNGTAIVYSTYLGGNNNEVGNSIAVDAIGCAYITGQTYSGDFPTTTNAFDTSPIGLADVFVSKLNPSGNSLIYSTYLGGTGVDVSYDITVDTSGDAFLIGRTMSKNYPTTINALDTSFNGGAEDVFVSELNPSGSALIYSTYLGGSSIDEGYGIVVDVLGNVYLTGYTESSDFPITIGAYDTTFNGYTNATTDVFVSKFNPSSTGLIYSTYLGGNGWDWGRSLSIDTFGNAYITGFTTSVDFPITVGAYDTTFNGYTNDTGDVFVSKLNPNGTGLIYSTYLGGSRWDSANSIAVDASGNAYITGYTGSSDYPITVGVWDTSFNGGSYDVFVSKLNSSGMGLVYSTFFGGSSNEVGYGIAVDDNENAYITGYTYSNDFPITVGSLDTSFNGNTDVFVSKISRATAADPVVWMLYDLK